MLEYGIKNIVTNPTLITKTNDIIKLVDNRTKTPRAFVLPASFAPIVERLSKEIEYKKWAKDKKAKLKGKTSLNLDENLMEIGFEGINEYLGNFDVKR
jgi:hypothetical protein